jgi:hypothetical protein
VKELPGSAANVPDIRASCMLTSGLTEGDSR